MSQLKQSHPLLPLYARSVLILSAVFAGSKTIWFAVGSLGAEHVHRKDVLQEYVLGWALREGTNPYLPLPELASKYVGSLPDAVFPHPTPHPPPVAFIGALLTPFEYPVAAGVWLMFEIGCIVAAIWLLLRHFGPKPTALTLALVTVAFLGTDAFFYELVLGQLQSLVLLLLVLAWLALRTRHDWAGGAALGVALALKFLGWPIVLFLVARRRWRAVWSALITTALLNGVAALAMGIGKVADYYLRVAPQVASLYRSDPWNVALSSIGWRVFWGTDSKVLVTLAAPPLLRWELGAAALSLAIPAVFAVFTVAAATRARSFDASFALLLCASALVNPIAWTHYAVLGTMAVIWIWRRLYAQGFRRGETYAAIAVTAALFLPGNLFLAAATLFSREDVVIGQSVIVPFSAGLITLFPAATLVALCVLVLRVDGITVKEAKSETRLLSRWPLRRVGLWKEPER